MAMARVPGRWAPPLVAILVVVGLAAAAGAADRQGVACPTRPPAPAQTIMTPDDPHAAPAIAPEPPGRAPRTAVATFALG